MGIRQKIAAKPKVVVPLVSIAIVAALGYSLWSVSDGLPDSSPKRFFTSDDGKSFFADDALKVVPFDNDGKSAVGAIVYECTATKTRFVACLERLSPEGQKALEKFRAAGQTPDGPEQMRLAEQMQMKRPGDDKWVPRTQFLQTFKPKCPDGSADAKTVMP